MEDIRVTPIQTGTVSIKSAQATGQPGRSALGLKLDIARDDEWLMGLPILTFLIDHPEGRFIIDTGDSARNSKPGYLPWWHPFFQYEVAVNVAPDEEIGPRLAELGLKTTRDIKEVILTHLHHDHAGGLHHFPYNLISVPREGWEFGHSSKGEIGGCLPQRWPPWFKPRLLEIDGPPIGPFPASYAVTEDGRIALVPTPGHLPGHVSVIVRADDVTYFIAADASYKESNIREGRTDGITMDPEVARQTIGAIKAFATSTPTVVLPSHDPHNIMRAKNRQLFARESDES